MKIDPQFTTINAGAALARAAAPPVAGAANAAGIDFGKGLTEALDKLGSLQTDADNLITQSVTGKVEDLNQVVLAVEKANLALQMGVAVRNKVVEAYSDIMHMQI